MSGINKGEQISSFIELNGRLSRKVQKPEQRVNSHAFGVSIFVTYSQHILGSISWPLKKCRKIWQQKNQQKIVTIFKIMYFE